MDFRPVPLAKLRLQLAQRVLHVQAGQDRIAGMVPVGTGALQNAIMQSPMYLSIVPQ
jgi:hypothetical protein